MLTDEQNQELTQVGPGTPCGELLRRYWHPFLVAADLTTERPKKRVRLLGEDLVVFRKPDGTYGLVAEQCAHRGASLYYGFVEDAGIRCAYHGWLYDCAGKCLEQPFEPAQSMMKHTVHHAAYPVQKLAGLLFAYLGPQPAPLLPRWDVLAREDGERVIEIRLPILNCNWLQCQENSLDPTHVYYLHGHTLVTKGLRKTNQYRTIESYEFEVIEWGIVKKREFGGDGEEKFGEMGHPAVFPNILHHGDGRGLQNLLDGTAPIDMHFRTPLDDTHTQVFWVQFIPTKDGSRVEQVEDPPVRYEYVKNEEGDFHQETFPSQDEMAWETQGLVANRVKERLGAGDAGIVMWRELLAQQIDIVREGGEPMGVIRDPERNRVIELGPSRDWSGERWVPKPWAGWNPYRVWKSPVTAGSVQESGAKSAGR
jgi:5,5'-dehydrodivanillate O-demethylase oxygenase subunit